MNCNNSTFLNSIRKERLENNRLRFLVEVSVVDDLFGIPHLRVGFAQDLLVFYFAVLEVEVVGDSRIPDVAKASRISSIEEANVGKVA